MTCFFKFLLHILVGEISPGLFNIRDFYSYILYVDGLFLMMLEGGVADVALAQAHLLQVVRHVVLIAERIEPVIQKQ